MYNITLSLKENKNGRKNRITCGAFTERTIYPLFRKGIGEIGAAVIGPFKKGPHSFQQS